MVLTTWLVGLTVTSFQRCDWLYYARIEQVKLECAGLIEPANE
jgi:hypothetical protein